MSEQQLSVPAAGTETVEAAAFLNHLLAISGLPLGHAISGLPPEHAMVQEAVAACGLAEHTAYTGSEMQAIEAAIAQKVQLKLAISNDPDVEGLKALVLSVNRLVASRREPF